MVEVFGKHYKSLASLSREYNIKRERLVYHIRKGQTIEEAIIHCQTSNILFRGNHYSKLVDLCIDYNKDSHLVSKRLRYGWTLEDALFKEVCSLSKAKSTEYRGRLYRSQKELMKDYGFSSAFIKSFVYRNKHIDFITAFDFFVNFFNKYEGDRPLLLNKVPYVIYNNIWCKDIDELSSLCGVDKYSLVYYMRYHKLDNPFTAMSYMKQSKVKKYRSGELFLNRKEAQVKFGRQIDTLLKHGIVLETDVPEYPECSFHMTGYCATPVQDLERILPVFLKSKVG